jgi:hypothetical protein
MKRSRIFLAVSAALLAIAGVAVAKTVKGPFHGYFLTQDQRFKCVSYTGNCVRVALGNTCLTVIKKSNGVQIKTINYTNSVCTHPLHYRVL